MISGTSCLFCVGRYQDGSFPIHSDAYGCYGLEDVDTDMKPEQTTSSNNEECDRDANMKPEQSTSSENVESNREAEMNPEQTTIFKNEEINRDSHLKPEQSTVSKNEKSNRDEETLVPNILPALSRPLLLSKKKLLFQQCSIGSKDICNISLLKDLLVDIGPNVRNEWGQTPLAIALKKLPKSINYDVFETLMKNGADAMVKYKTGRGLIADIIFYYGDHRLISSYLAFHKDINAALNNFDESALHILTFRKGSNLVINLLKRKAQPDIKDKSGRTPLHVAVQRGSPKIMEILISSGANINAVCNEGQTPLHYACGMVDKGSIDVLLKHKCEVNVHDAKKRTPLFYFIKCPCNQDVLLEKLFNAGCRIKDASKSFRPLHMLATEGVFKKNAVKYADVLVRRGIDVNGLNGRSCTALHLAARFSTDKFVKWLFENGADYNVVTRRRQTALDIASRWGQKDVAIQIVKAVSVDRQEGKTICGKIITKIESNPTLNISHRNFCRELQKLSEANGEVSYFDIYRADWSTLLEYTRNNKIVCFVDKLDDVKFPLYGKDIKKKFQEALRRRLAIDSALDSLYWLFGGNLPFVCLKHLTKYLPSEDLEMLSRVRVS